MYLLMVILQIMLGGFGSIWQLVGTQYILKRLSCAKGANGRLAGCGHCLLLNVWSGARSTGLA